MKMISWNKYKTDLPTHVKRNRSEMFVSPKWRNRVSQAATASGAGPL